jgi:hypothetical protein
VSQGRARGWGRLVKGRDLRPGQYSAIVSAEQKWETLHDVSEKDTKFICWVSPFLLNPLYSIYFSLPFSLRGICCVDVCAGRVPRKKARMIELCADSFC